MPVAWIAPAVLSALIVFLLVVVWYLLTKQRNYRAEMRDEHAYLVSTASQRDEAVAEAAEAKKRFDSLFERVEGYLNERNTWQQLYYQQASEHGSAQEMMLSERQRLVTQLRRAKMQPKLNPVIEQVAEHFRETHSDPARRALQKAASANEKPKDDHEPAVG